MKIRNIFCTPDQQLIDIYRIFDSAVQFGLPSGIALVVNGNGELKGTVTEGDIRRGIIRNNDIGLCVKDVMQENPICFSHELSITEILERIPGELAKRNRRSRKFLSKIVLVDENKRPIRVLDYHQLWEQRVASHRHLVVIGLGYVGLTMAVVMADAGFLVTGVEVDENRLAQLRKGNSYVHEVGLEELLKEQISKNLRVSNCIPDDGDVFIISVGTPVSKDAEGTGRPNMAFLEEACNNIGTKLKHGNLVVLRSTVPVGTCRNYVMARLEQISGLVCGIDFHLSFAPERTAEGKALKELRSLPQIIGGYNKDSLEATSAVFRDLTPTIIKVESLEAAEMSKLVNNSFRDYVFAYANQIARIACEFNINVVDVIKAANEGYPRDPVPLPSPGVGGPCLTKDPYIFASVADQIGGGQDIFIKGRLINESMHEFVYTRTIEQIKYAGKKLPDCKVLICGLAFKGQPETGDIRNSSSIEIANLFRGNVKELYGYDAIAMDDEIRTYGLIPVEIPEAFSGMDAVLFLNNHKSFDKVNLFEMVRAMNDNPIIFDGWNIFRYEDIISTRPCTYLGLSFIKTSIQRSR